MQNLNQKVNQQQNTVILEQQIYTSPQNFTPTLLVMLETFRRSALWWTEGWISIDSFVANQEIFRANSIPGLAVTCNLMSGVYFILSPREIPEKVSTEQVRALEWQPQILVT